MKEQPIEAKFVKECHKRGLLCFKFVSPSRRGVSDRLVIGKHGVVGFYEMKRPGEKPTKLQAYFLRLVRERNCPEGVVDEVADIKTLLDRFQELDNDPLR